MVSCEEVKGFNHIGNRQAFQAVVPELEMQLDPHGDFGIEDVAAPLPPGLANQRREVIGREVFDGIERFVPECEYGVARGVDPVR